jgi:hypothetical protein
MGMTIHYRGQLKSPDSICPLSDELEDIAKSLGWKTQRLDGDLGRENTARLVHTKKGATITGYLPLRGICLSPGKGCEGIDRKRGTVLNISNSCWLRREGGREKGRGDGVNLSTISGRPAYEGLK